MDKRRRLTTGKYNARSTLVERVKLLHERGKSQGEIAEEVMISKPSVSRILNGKYSGEDGMYVHEPAKEKSELWDGDKQIKFDLLSKSWGPKKESSDMDDEEFINRISKFMDDVMPQMSGLCIQDFANLNLLLMEVTRRKKCIESQQNSTELKVKHPSETSTTL